ncbi:hypothetical protein O0I10_006152 [Lichtheimia ornata]|uniref:Uncharacterized protein n=1 Tax=Lichtheimia ornata TaxID=688661 RepID=A0AAD7XXH4_9FUNG|nr:uncharacterized protein O0I10_006152 [Lichtheimia ornata]KAJ8658145.1 hypothetical protein O0I10_006152 [Lichtheimia ornata]
MFTNLVSNIREKFGKKEDEGGIGQQQQHRPSIMVEQSTAKNESGRLSVDEQASEGLWRRASDGQLYDKSRLSPTRAQPIPVQQRRRATFYGISNVSADDYMQKDLISGSWS